MRNRSDSILKLICRLAPGATRGPRLCRGPGMHPGALCPSPSPHRFFPGAGVLDVPRLLEAATQTRARALIPFRARRPRGLGRKAAPPRFCAVSHSVNKPTDWARLPFFALSAPSAFGTTLHIWRSLETRVLSLAMSKIARQKIYFWKSNDKENCAFWCQPRNEDSEVRR